MPSTSCSPRPPSPPHPPHQPRSGRDPAPERAYRLAGAGPAHPGQRRRRSGTGAAGAVGRYLVELAAARGLRVIALAGPQDERQVRGFGADVFVVRSNDPAAAMRAAVPGGVAALVDAAALGQSTVAAVRDGGAFVSVLGGGPPPERGIRVSRVSVHSDAGQLAELAALADAGRLTPRVARTLSFTHAAEAHAALARRGLRGRIVLVP